MRSNETTPLHPKEIATLLPGEHPDGGKGGCPGLILRVRPNGSRSWVVRYGIRADRITLAPADGRPGSLDLKRARRRAKVTRAEIEAVGGREYRRRVEAARLKAIEDDAKLEAEKKAPTFGVMAADILATASLKPSTRRAWESVVTASIEPHLGGLKPAEITKADVRKCLATVRLRSVWAADSAHKVLTWIFTLAVERDLVPSSPMVGLRREDFRVKDGGRRKKVGSPDELRGVWNAAEMMGAYGSAVRLALLTLARRGEIFEARVSEFDLHAKVWRIPAERRKNGEPLDIPLSDTALEIVQGLVSAAKVEGSRGYLLPGDTGAIAATSKAWARLLAAAGIVRESNKEATEDGKTAKADGKKRKKWTAHPLRFHDLRRAGRSIMETELAIAASVAEGVIGHLAPSLVRTYSPQGVGLPERRRAVEKWNAHLVGIIEAKPKEKGRVVAGQFGR